MSVREDVIRRETIAASDRIPKDKREFYRQVNLYLKRQAATTLGLPTTSTSSTSSSSSSTSSTSSSSSSTSSTSSTTTA